MLFKVVFSVSFKVPQLWKCTFTCGGYICLIYLTGHPVQESTRYQIGKKKQINVLKRSEKPTLKSGKGDTVLNINAKNLGDFF